MSAEVLKTCGTVRYRRTNMLMVYQSEIVLVEEEWKRTAVTDVAIPSYSGKRKKKHKNREKEQGVTV